MNPYFFVSIFIICCFALSWLSSQLVTSLVSVARYLRWREFIIAFFVMAMAASLPNFFIDLSAVLRGMPQLAFGDIVGGNLVDLTLVLAVSVFFSKNGLSAESEMVQKSAMFMTGIALLPLLLVIDGKLGRFDGVILITSFILYSFWIFSKKEHFKKVYKYHGQNIIYGFKSFLINVLKIGGLVTLLLIVSHVIVNSAQFFSDTFGISLALVGILIVGLGNCFPELYFSVISARNDQNWLVLGDIMGSVIIVSTLVLGVIALISPFKINDFSPFFTAMIFLVISSVVSLYFILSGKKITKKEGLFLLFIYIIFILVEIFIQ